MAERHSGDIDDIMRERTVYASHPNVYYEPYVGVDGRVGYRVQTNNAGDTRELFVYLNPSTDTDDGTPNIFVYVGENNDPAHDFAYDFHIALPELEDGPLLDCGHNMHQRDSDGECHGCVSGEARHDG